MATRAYSLPVIGVVRGNCLSQVYQLPENVQHNPCNNVQFDALFSQTNHITRFTLLFQPVARAAGFEGFNLCRTHFKKQKL